jgi:hypothetical protein
MSLQQYYDDFRQGYWATEDPATCLCRGHGWALSDLDTWHQCPVHYRGQLHPEDCYQDECPECGDGRTGDPRSCSRCGEQLRRDLENAKDHVEKMFPLPPYEPPTDDDIPF